MEFVLWVPFFALFIMFVTDASLAFMRQSDMWQVARETARVVSRYGMDEATAEQFAAIEAAIGSTLPTVDVSFSSGNVIVAMAMPTSAITAFGSFDFISGDTINVAVTHTMEPL